MLAAAKQLASRLAPVLRTSAAPKGAFRLAPPSRSKAVRAAQEQQPSLPAAKEQQPSLPGLDPMEEAGLRLLALPDAEVAPYVAKLVGKDCKDVKEEGVYRYKQMWGPTGRY